MTSDTDENERFVPALAGEYHESEDLISLDDMYCKEEKTETMDVRDEMC